MQTLRKISTVYSDEGFWGVLYRASKKIFGYKSTAIPKAPNPVATPKYVEPKYVQGEEPCRHIPPDREKIRKFHNKHKGERCFIIGNGPSLNKLDLSKLDNEITFGVNGIFYKTKEMGLRPTYYVVEDSHVMLDNVEAINDYEVKGQKFFPTDYKKHITKMNQTTFFLMNRGFYLGSSPNWGVPRFSMDCAERLYCGQSVTMINLQLAHYMGFEKVYLIGMDFSYTIPKSAIVEGTNITSTEDDPNHFHPEYFGKGKKWHDPKLEEVLKNYKMAGLVYECKGRKIYNATAGGQLEVFDRVDYNSLF